MLVKLYQSMYTTLDTASEFTLSFATIYPYLCWFIARDTLTIVQNLPKTLYYSV